MTAQMTAETAVHRYRPRGACRAIFRTRDPEVLLSGPAGTGKSRACLEKMFMTAVQNKTFRGLICRKTAATMSSTVLVTWRKFVIPEAILTGDVVYYGGSAQEPAQYRFANGAVINIAGLDKITKIMSSEYDMIYIQEATEVSEDDWESLTTRLRNWGISYQQMIADCNPAQPTHWLKQRSDHGRTKLMDTRHEDNPVLFTADGAVTDVGADYLAKLDKLTGVRYQRLRLGRWSAAEGVIYEEFCDIHCLDRIQAQPGSTLDHAGVPVHWRRYWSVDFGFVNPFVLQCWAEDEDGRLYLYRELYMTRRTVDQHAKSILDIVAPVVAGTFIRQWIEPKPTTVVCDHDAEGRAVLERELEMGTTAAHKSVLEGIEAVQVRLRDPGDGRPRIFFLRNAVAEPDPELVDSGKPMSTLDEIPGYTWTGKNKEEPIKADDHGCDATRYLVAERDMGIRAMYRSIQV
jgi:PBSX family phage terminase large subunit